MKKKTLWLLGVVLSGCQYYQGNAANNQPSPPLWVEATAYEKTYPFLEIYTPLEIDTLIDDPSEGSCQFQMFAAFWEYYHDQLADTQIHTQKILSQSACSLSHRGATWLDALLYEDRQYWNKGLLALGPLLQSPSHPFYIPALGLSHRLDTSRTTSKLDLSPDELAIIEQQRLLLQRYQSPPESPALPFQVVLIAESNPPKEFFESLIAAFENQTSIESLHVFAKDSPRAEILHALQLPQTVLIGYHLTQPLPKEYLMESQYSITVGEDFVKHRDTDYWVCDPLLQMLQSVRYDPFCVDPQLILFEEGILSSKVLKYLEKQKTLLDVTGPKLQSVLSQLAALPQRQEAFQKVFSKKIHYIPRPKLLPHTILCLTRADTLRTLHTHFLAQGQNKTLLLADAQLLSGQPSLDKSLQGVLFYTHPFDKMPKTRLESDLGSDLIDLVQRLPRFAKEDTYVYHGKMGAYFLKNQQLRAQRWWSRYRAVPAPNDTSSAGGSDREPSVRPQL